MKNNDNKPLTGIKVVELATYIAATVCGRLLADMGAEVIKIESLQGDPWREVSIGATGTSEDENPEFDVFNTGKKSVCLNIKKTEGRELLEKMIADADIFITNTRQKSLVKMGLDVESLTAKYPRLIYANITGYGETGPQCDAPGFDNVAFWTNSGFRADMITKAPGSYPMNSPTGGGDSVTGSVLFGEILLALYQRQRTGKGDHASVSLYNAGLWTFCGPIIEAQEKYRGKFPKERRDCFPVNTVYECADGEWIAITILDYARLAPRLYELTGMTEEIARLGIKTYEESGKCSDAIIWKMEDAFRQKTSKEWLELLEEADIVCGLVNHFADVAKSEQAWANNYLQEYTCRNGSVCVMPVPPYRLASCGVPMGHTAPLPGENTREILLQYGYSEYTINELVESGVVC